MNNIQMRWRGEGQEERVRVEGEADGVRKNGKQHRLRSAGTSRCNSRASASTCRSPVGGTPRSATRGKGEGEEEKGGKGKKGGRGGCIHKSGTQHQLHSADISHCNPHAPANTCRSPVVGTPRSATRSPSSYSSRACGRCCCPKLEGVGE
jgi:hypothetical protein